MARSAFFSFHYQRDIWRTNVVRNSHVVVGHAAAGFRDKSLWEETKIKGDAAIHRLIDDALIGTSITVVLIGSQTSNRKYVNYEIQQSIKRGNGILGVHIHMIKDSAGNADIKGNVPKLLTDNGYKVINWPYDSAVFSSWIDYAYANR